MRDFITILMLPSKIESNRISESTKIYYPRHTLTHTGDEAVVDKEEEGDEEEEEDMRLTETIPITHFFFSLEFTMQSAPTHQHINTHKHNHTTQEVM